MTGNQQDESILYKVVVNHEEQYSIWPLELANPPGWSDGGKRGAKTACLTYIAEVWTDMRPLSVRTHAEPDLLQEGRSAS